MPLVSVQQVSEDYMASDTLQVYFRQNEIVLDTLFRDNAKRLNLFVDHFNRLRKNPLKNVKGILIVSGASPKVLILVTSFFPKIVLKSFITI